LIEVLQKCIQFLRENICCYIFTELWPRLTLVPINRKLHSETEEHLHEGIVIWKEVESDSSSLGMKIGNMIATIVFTIHSENNVTKIVFLHKFFFFLFTRISITQ